MGKRSPVEGTVGILSAFLRRRTWQQAELARELGLEPRTVRRHLNELTRQGFPLEREDDPPHVYWSMPKDWFPGGVLLESKDAQLLLKLLCRMPASKDRDALLQRISSSLPRQDDSVPALASVFHGLGDEPRFVALVTEAALQRATLHVHYHSARRGALEWRHLSVQRVTLGPPARMVARCHRTDTLRWFRIDGITEARLAPDVPYRESSPAEVGDYLTKSLDGYAADEAPIEHCFFVADPDARWVVRNLLPSMIAEPLANGVRIRCRTTAAPRLARFVLNLAPVARVETPELAKLVTELAAATLALHGRAKSLHGGTKEPPTALPAAGQREAAFDVTSKPGRAGHRKDNTRRSEGTHGNRQRSNQ